MPPIKNLVFLISELIRCVKQYSKIKFASQLNNRRGTRMIEEWVIRICNLGCLHNFLAQSYSSFLIRIVPIKAISLAIFLKFLFGVMDFLFKALFTWFARSSGIDQLSGRSRFLFVNYLYNRIEKYKGGIMGEYRSNLLESCLQNIFLLNRTIFNLRIASIG